MPEYRFLKTKSGKTYFAAVSVRAVNPRDTWTAMERLSTSINKITGEVSRATAPDWIDSAMQGLKEVAAKANREGVLPCRTIELLSVTGTTIDTTPDIVYCAAVLAAWPSAFPGIPEPNPIFDGVWHISL